METTGLGATGRKTAVLRILGAKWEMRGEIGNSYVVLIAAKNVAGGAASNSKRLEGALNSKRVSNWLFKSFALRNGWGLMVISNFSEIRKFRASIVLFKFSCSPSI